jgi:hypothetical protein
MSPNGFLMRMLKPGRRRLFQLHTAWRVKRSLCRFENSTLSRSPAHQSSSQKDLELSAIVVDDGVGEENPFRLIVSTTTRVK